jgi:DNA-binding transcriptional LysR family regulator
MELRHLRYFVAVAEELHFGRAAARLQMTQPALSKAVRQLEGSVSAKLLERNSRHVRLTAAGEVFLEKARLAIAASEEGVSLARRATRGEVGQLSLGLSWTAKHSANQSVVGAFCATYPDVTVINREALSVDLVADVRDRIVEVAVAALPPRLDGLGYRLLRQEPLVAALPSSHRLADRSRIPLEDLSDEQWLLPSERAGSAYNQALRHYCRQAGFDLRRAEGDVLLDTDLQEVRQGRAIHVLPAGCDAASLGRSGVAIVALEPPPTVPVELVWRREDVSPIAERFIEFASRMSAHEGWTGAVADGSSPSRTDGD